ncbi:hypothetical protein [Phytoactinopolyspora halotolerans]|uniref:Uncharacterized protein n=1 Tax=Phytoactinopolyspora halotolerans TaxID=1981512 RepID=A0A6L9SFY0_9ACTN|nr:hypothetical protein [Phytoactinopolyspora halotolerans]NEE02980.1 hypothetical protein [Phytoactinopolyspora halotolerans]
MTITMSRIETQPYPASNSDADGVLGTLHDTLDTVSELDPDLLHSDTLAGHAIVTLAGAARAAVTALGTASGTALREASGVVVVRDLVAAVSLLELAVSRRGGPSDPRALEQIARRANTAYGRLLLAAPSATKSGVPCR